MIFGEVVGYFLNTLLLFHCFLGHLPRNPFQIPLIWYIYHLSRSHRSWDMTDWPVSLNAFWSKFSDPYFGPGSTQKPKIWREFFFMVSNNLTKNHSNRWWSCQVPCWFGTEWPCWLVVTCPKNLIIFVLGVIPSIPTNISDNYNLTLIIWQTKHHHYTFS